MKTIYCKSCSRPLSSLRRRLCSSCNTKRQRIIKEEINKIISKPKEIKDDFRCYTVMVDADLSTLQKIQKEERFYNKRFNGESFTNHNLTGIHCCILLNSDENYYWKNFMIDVDNLYKKYPNASIGIISKVFNILPYKGKIEFDKLYKIETEIYEWYNQIRLHRGSSEIKICED